METGSSTTHAISTATSRERKEEKQQQQKKKLGLRRLLPAIFSPKDSRKDGKKNEQRYRRDDERDGRRYGTQLERKHSLQEPKHAGGNGRDYYGPLWRNRGPSGRISAPPSERYSVRTPRFVHPPVDGPLPGISQTRLASYDDDYGDRGPRCDGDLGGLYSRRRDSGDCGNQSAFYSANDRDDLEIGPTSDSAPRSVPAQVKIARQSIVNRTRQAPLIGRTLKAYPSSGDYVESSCP